MKLETRQAGEAQYTGKLEAILANRSKFGDQVVFVITPKKGGTRIGFYPAGVQSTNTALLQDCDVKAKDKDLDLVEMPGDVEKAWADPIKNKKIVGGVILVKAPTDGSELGAIFDQFKKFGMKTLEEAVGCDFVWETKQITERSSADNGKPFPVAKV